MSNIYDAIDKTRLEIINEYDIQKSALDKKKSIMIDFVENTVCRIIDEIREDREKDKDIIGNFYFVENIPSELSNYHSKLFILRCLENTFLSGGFTRVEYAEYDLEDVDETPLIYVYWK